MFLIFATYVQNGEILTAEIAFFTLSLYNVSNTSMCYMLPVAIQAISESLISIRRIQNFLLLEEVNGTSKSEFIEKSHSVLKGF